MKKQSFTEIALYLITGLLPLVGYYLLMTEIFKKDPFRGYYLIITIYLIICYLLYPKAGLIVSEQAAGKKTFLIFPAKTQLLFAYIFAPLIVVKKLVS